MISVDPAVVAARRPTAPRSIHQAQLAPRNRPPEQRLDVAPLSYECQHARAIPLGIFPSAPDRSNESAGVLCQRKSQSHALVELEERLGAVQERRGVGRVEHGRGGVVAWRPGYCGATASVCAPNLDEPRGRAERATHRSPRPTCPSGRTRCPGRREVVVVSCADGEARD